MTIHELRDMGRYGLLLRESLTVHQTALEMSLFCAHVCGFVSRAEYASGGILLRVTRLAYGVLKVRTDLSRLRLDLLV